MFHPDLLEAPPAAADAVGGAVAGSGVGSGSSGSSVDGAGRPLTLEVLVAEARRSLAACRGERLDARQATAVVRWANELVRVGEALRLVGLGRVDETGAWDGDDSGARNVRTWAANTLGVEAGEAGRLLEAAAAVRDHREVEELVRSGEVAPTVVAEVAKTVAVKPDRAGEICDAARAAENPRDAKDRLRRVRQEGESEIARQARHHKERSLRVGSDDEGRLVAHLSGPGSDRAELEALLAPFLDQAFRQARAEGRHEPQAAYAYDVLFALLRAAATPGATGDGGLPPGYRRGGADAKVIIRIDEAALARGWVAPGETCTLNGDPVDVTTAADAVAMGAFVTAVSTKIERWGKHRGKERVQRVNHLGRSPDLVDELRSTLLPAEPAVPDENPIRRALKHEAPIAPVVHDGRKPTAKQRTALQWMHPTCAVPGCPNRLGLEIDHETPWCLTGQTTLHDLQTLCPAHHHAKTAREAQERAKRRRTQHAADRGADRSRDRGDDRADARAPDRDGACAAVRTADGDDRRPLLTGAGARHGPGP